MKAQTNELERALERTTLEPAFASSFYRCLLESEVYALVPEGEVVTPRNTIRFVMWTGADGERIIPFFSSARLVEQALAPTLQGVCMSGQTFLQLSRGAPVVLNPNEAYYCRLSASEIEALLATGTPDAPQPYVASLGQQVWPAMPPGVPDELLQSLSLVCAQRPEIERAYMVSLRNSDSDPAVVWLVAALVHSDDAIQWLAQQIASLMASRPPTNNVDLTRLAPGSELFRAIESNASPFYNRNARSTVVLDAQTGVQ